MSIQSPNVYISYSHDSETHNAWVRKLAERLRADGVNAILDQWELMPGVVIREWQEQSLQKSDAVLVVVTSAYTGRAADHWSGVCHDLRVLDERSQASSVLIIPVFPPGFDFSLPVPRQIEGRYGVRLPDDITSSAEYTHLINALFERNRSLAPKVGPPRTTKREPRKARPSSPVILNHLRIEHFRRIESVDFQRCPSDEAAVSSRGQWTVLLGENGTGKSSLLWGIGLALLDSELAHGLLANLSSPLVRGESGTASVTVQSGAEQFGFRAENAERRERFAELPRPADFMVFAYGAARGSAFGGPDRAVELDRPLDAVGTLFGLRTSLIHAETWLRGLEHGALKQEASAKHAHLFETVRSTLLNVLPGVEEIEVDVDRVRFRGPAVGDCGLASLSDGYATTLGWVVDMLARWIHEQQRLNLPIKPRFNEEMTGLVLIDELDLHLHPRWQMQIVSDLRRAFPKMSFVATTHNPLTLLGAEPGEVHVLHYDQERLQISQVDLPPGIRADQVLTGVWFGLSSTLDAETRKLLDQHRALLRKGAGQSDPKRLKLERELRLRLGSYADTAEDRLAQEVVSQHMSDTDSKLSSADVENVRTKIKSALASRK